MANEKRRAKIYKRVNLIEAREQFAKLTTQQSTSELSKAIALCSAVPSLSVLAALPAPLRRFPVSANRFRALTF